MINFQDKVSFIWSIAEVLRGPYKPEDYGKVILPLAVLRRFDCVLEKTGGSELDPQKHGASGVVEDEKVRLSSILEKLNDRFGTEFSETDYLSREQVKEDILNSDDIRQKAKNNTKENFKFAFERTFMDFVIDRMNTNQDFFMKILENPEFKAYIMEDMMNEVYGEVNS